MTEKLTREGMDNLIVRMLNTAKFSDNLHPPAGSLLREAATALHASEPRIRELEEAAHRAQEAICEIENLTDEHTKSEVAELWKELDGAERQLDAALARKP